MLENEYAVVTRRSIEHGRHGQRRARRREPGDRVPGAAIRSPSQLKIVARLIGARAALGMRRQVFFVSLGGFDNHNLLMQDHPNLMTRVNEALSAFYAATVELGVADKVTTFTASDFGRTLARTPTARIMAGAAIIS